MKYKITGLLTTILLGAAVASAANMDGEWRIYPSYDAYPTKVIDTKDCTYILADAEIYKASAAAYANQVTFFYAFDKGTNELRFLNNTNYLSETLVKNIDYNPVKGYLMIVYANSNIDFLYDDGSVRNIPGMMISNFASSKNVNSVSFDPANDRVYVATDFGYIVIDDKALEIKESHIYNEALSGITRVGDYLVAVNGTKAMISPLGANHLSLEAFTDIDGISSPTAILNLDGDKFAYLSGGNVYSVEVAADGTVSAPATLNGGFGSVVANNKTGYVFNGGSNLCYLGKDGSTKKISIPSAHKGGQMGSWDLAEFFTMFPRKGLISQKYDGSKWGDVTPNYIRPNASASFNSQFTAYNPSYGILTLNHGYKRPFLTNTVNVPNLLSGIKDSEWSVYSPVYKDSKYAKIGMIPNEFAVDPDDPKYVYCGSYYGGICRLNLEDPSDILIMSHPSDPAAGLDGTVHKVIIPDHSWKEYCNFNALKFDTDGNLWALASYTTPPAGYGLTWFWPAADRRKGDASKWVNYTWPGYAAAPSQSLLTLKHPSNKNLLVMANGDWDAPLFVVDTNGTPEDPSDDTVVSMPTVYDQDGTVVTKNYTFKFFEDASGNVWVCTFNGIFYFNPRTALTNPGNVTRIKVPRNDGTNLADYLLDNVGVLSMADDPLGRHWFATNGGGVVCTSADGRTVLSEFTQENSDIPSDIVYAIEYNPDTASLFVSTSNGYAEFFPAGASSGSDLESVRAYPNPVRPDFLGWLTVDGLTDGALVKITDAEGNIVKELGLASGGSVQWDMTNSSFQRVASGVYYVLASSGSGDSSLAKATKILVIN